MNNSQKRYRVGLVGAGHISEFHIQGLRRLDNVEIVGITDLDQERAQQSARDFDLPKVFASYEEMLAADLDVVHVLTPPNSHANLTIQALEAGCDVFVEKPLAASVADCDRIAEVATRLNRTVGVDHSLLKDPFTEKAIQAVNDGAIGDVLSVTCLRSQDSPPYEGGPLPPNYREGGFPFRDLGIHSLYQIESFLGEIKDMSWHFDHRGHDWNLHFDEWHALVKCEKGTAQVHISWNARPLQDLIIVQGTTGVIHIDRFGMNITTKKTRPLPEHPQRAFNAVFQGVQASAQVPINLAKIVTKKIRRYHGLQEMVADFYQSLSDGAPATVTVDDARRVGFWVEQVAVDADRQKEEYLNQFPTELQAKTLVTGATGFIGGHLLDRLLQEGQPIRLFVRRKPARHIYENPLIEVVIGDLGDPKAVDKAMAGITTLYHIAGTVHGAPHDFRRGSVVGTQNIVDSALKHGVEKVVYMSSLSVIHSALAENDSVIDEQWPREPNAELRGNYTQTKLDAELIVVKAAAEQNLPVVLLRPAEVIGPGAPLLSSGIGQRVKNMLVMFGDGNLEVPLINVADVVDAIVLAKQTELPNGTIIQLVDPQGMSQNELAAKYSQMTGDELRIIHVPKKFMLFAGFCIQNLCKVLGRSAPLSVYRVKSALAPRAFQCNRAKELLDWTPSRGIIAALEDTLNAAQQTPNNKAIANPIDNVTNSNDIQSQPIAG